jgi:hypothetical protein
MMSIAYQGNRSLPVEASAAGCCKNDPLGPVSSSRAEALS